jgi:Raf kinase inhibitor-like YbhB/YbcL family protein
MLEKVPAGVGRALSGVRAGAQELAVADTELTGVNAAIEVTSPAFANGEQIPARYTADGVGVSPPLEWRCIPGVAEAVVILVEDADSPTPKPLVHAIVWDLPGLDGSLIEGAISAAGTNDQAHSGAADPSTQPKKQAVGRNSYLTTRYLPPDPPRGHGAHRYVFQVFALDRKPQFDSPPGRAALLDSIRNHVVAKGLLIGTYLRS